MKFSKEYCSITNQFKITIQPDPVVIVVPDNALIKFSDKWHQEQVTLLLKRYMGQVEERYSAEIHCLANTIINRPMHPPPDLKTEEPVKES